MISLPKTALRAALYCAAVKDVRYYLKGVHIDCAHNGDVHIVSTDGSMLFAGRIPAADVQWTGEPQKGPWRLTVPFDTIKRESKGHGAVILKPLDILYQLGDTVFTPVGGMFPDWRRVVGCNGPVGLPLQVNPSLMSDAQAAVQTWEGGEKSSSVSTWVEHFTDEGKIRVLGQTSNVLAIIMSLRQKRDKFPSAPFKPCAYEAPKEA